MHEQVSLYIPCYNAANYLTDTLDGVMKQTYKPAEILIIDDGSNDKTISIAQKYPVRIISHPKNLDLAQARNTALEAAQNSLIAALDADCIPDPKWLENLILALDKKDIGVGGRVIERPPQANISNIWRSLHMNQSWGEHSLNNPPFLYGANTLYRKEALLAVGCYDISLRHNYEDCDMSKRLTMAGKSYTYNADATVYHIKEDTVLSALRCLWAWHQRAFPIKRSFVRLISNRIGMIAHYFNLSAELIKMDLLHKRPSFVVIDFLFFFYACLKQFQELTLFKS